MGRVLNERVQSARFRTTICKLVARIDQSQDLEKILRLAMWYVFVKGREEDEQ